MAPPSPTVPLVTSEDALAAAIADDELIAAGYGIEEPDRPLVGRVGADGKERVKESAFVLVRGSDVKIERIEWAWERRIPLDAVTLIPGREGLGKTTLVYELAARLTKGELAGDLLGAACDVVVITSEDAVASVHAPRLMAAGADMARVFFLQSADKDTIVPFVVPGDVDALNQLLDQVANPRLVIVDPLDSALECDTHKKAETQRAIGYLAILARTRHLAVAGIAHHSKSPTTDPLDRVNGSKAFTSTTRSVLTIAPHPEDKEIRVVVANKANLTGRDVPVLQFGIEARTVEADGIVTTVSGVVWKGIAEGFDPDAVLAPAEDEDSRSRLEAAKAWLEAVLQGGPASSSNVKKWAVAADIAPSTLHRARLDLEVIVTADDQVRGRPTTWTWNPECFRSKGFVPNRLGTKPIPPVTCGDTSTEEGSVPSLLMERNQGNPVEHPLFVPKPDPIADDEPVPDWPMRRNGDVPR